MLKKKHKKMILRIVIASVITAALVLGAFFELYELDKEVLFFLYLVPYVIISYDVLIKAAKGELEPRRDGGR